MFLTDDEKWAIVEACDGSYDGFFFVCVKTTGIFCRPSCKARTPFRKNILFCDTAQEAIDMGFRACKRCRPDLAVYRPMEEAAKQIKEMIDAYFIDTSSLLEHLNSLGFTPNHLSVIFRNYYGITPFEYRNQLRIEAAAEMLHCTNEPISKIAFTCGFESLSAFYRLFNKNFSQTPTTYRKHYKEVVS